VKISEEFAVQQLQRRFFLSKFVIHYSKYYLRCKILQENYGVFAVRVNVISFCNFTGRTFGLLHIIIPGINPCLSRTAGGYRYPAPTAQ
jgi:hypothetical protein